jgi:hypothetical protein
MRKIKKGGSLLGFMGAILKFSMGKWNGTAKSQSIARGFRVT